jgi:hypothetical protein
MKPHIRAGDYVKLEPLTPERRSALRKGDIVLARVRGSVYLHFITAIEYPRIQVGNAHGHINGWTSKVYGKVTKIEHNRQRSEQ